jgi:hypothetical protein
VLILCNGPDCIEVVEPKLLIGANDVLRFQERYCRIQLAGYLRIPRLKQLTRYVIVCCRIRCGPVMANMGNGRAPDYLLVIGRDEHNVK